MTRSRARARAVAAGMAVVAIGSALTVSQSASAAPGVGATAALVAPSNVVVGSVLSNGKPDVGATVIPLVWPNDASLIAAQGSAVNTATKALPAVVTDATGRFAVPLNLSTLPAMYLDTKGRPNIELQIADATKMTSWSFTAVPNAAKTGFTSHAADGTDSTSPETVSIDLGAGTSTEITGTAAAAFRAASGASAKPSGVTEKIYTTRVPAQMKAARAKLAAAPAVAAAPCVYGAGFRSETNRVEPFTHAYPGAQAPVTVTQRYGVDHGIGIAVGGSGGWSGGAAGGTRTVSLAASGTMRAPGNSTMFNSLNFNDYINVCGWTHRQVISVYAILSRVDAAAEPNFLGCTTYTSGTYTKSRGVNITYKSEVNVGPVSVNAQSGYNNDTELTWTVVHKSQLCGSSTASGWVSSGEAEANSYAYP